MGRKAFGSIAIRWFYSGSKKGPNDIEAIDSGRLERLKRVKKN